MIEFNRKMGPFSIREIWFSEDIYDVDDADAIQFKNSSFSGEKPGFAKEVSTTLVLDLSRSLEDIFNSMEKKSCRHHITKAVEEGIVIRFNDRFAEFYEINKAFRKNKGLTPFIMDPEEMKKNYVLATYEKDGKVLGGHLCIKDDNHIRQLVSASTMNWEPTISRSTYGRGNRLSIWELIKYAKGAGIGEYDFGGYATGQLGEELKGINEFKAGFGGHMIEKYSYYKSYSKSYSASKSVFLSAISAGNRIKRIGKSKSAKPSEEEAKK
jgi:lipid II:glycine glycyltransferase (peptidoglycan interpeptide bridge formation enzyme)